MADALTWALKPTKPVLGKLDQGWVFTCARAEDYLACPVFGLTITARCDIAHDKAAIYSYLPIVNLRDWWHVDGFRILVDRAHRQQLGALKQILREAGFSPSVLASETATRITDVLFPPDVTGNRAKLRQRALVVAESITRLAGAKSSASSSEVGRFCAEFPKLRKATLDDLLAHQLLGYYFLPQVEADGADEGFVVLLREVHQFPRALAQLVASGIQRPADASTGSIDLLAHLSFEHYDFAMPIGVLPSPLTEHIMQNFSLLFTRIGLDDLPQGYIDGLWDRLGLDIKS